MIDFGIATLRGSLLTSDNTFQWGRVHDLIEQQNQQEAEEAVARVRHLLGLQRIWACVGRPQRQRLLYLFGNLSVLIQTS